MTTIYQGVTVLTYEEWLKLPEVAEYLGERVEECLTCDGSGDHICECGDEHPCGACDGTGTIEDFRNIYEKQLREEINKLQNYVAKLMEGRYENQKTED